MRILRAINKQICIAVFAFIFSTSIGYMMGTLHVIEIMEEKAKLVDNLNQAELELFEAERQLVHCDSELGHKMNAMLEDGAQKSIYVITPTYTRPSQQAELSSLAQSLAHIPYLTWVVMEFTKTQLVSDFLEGTNLEYLHLDSAGKITGFSKDINACNVLRNVALDHLANNKKVLDGVIIFGNTDRIYNSDMFEKIRRLQRDVGIWPTGLTTDEFSCKPLKFVNTKSDLKYPLNIASVGFSSKIVSQGLHFEEDVSDTTGVSRIVEQLVENADQIQAISCDITSVWYIPSMIVH